MVLLGIIISIIIFSIIVLFHEYGHYKIARLFGIHVEEFWLGIPPRAKKLWKNKDWTLFSLNWIPLGGFVKISGENDIHFTYYDKNKKKISQKSLIKKWEKYGDIFDKKGKKISETEKKYIFAKIQSLHPWKNFFEKNIFQKSAVLIAGVVMNFLLAAVIFSFLFFLWVKPVGINSFIPTKLPSKLIPTIEYAISEGFIIQEKWVIIYPIEGSIAEASGIQSGDILFTVNGFEIKDIKDLQKRISQNALSEISLSFNDKNIQIIPDNNGKIGAYLSPNYNLQEDFKYKYNFRESIKYGFLETYIQARLTFSGLTILLKNIISPEKPEDREEALEKVAGPIGIVGVVTNALTWGFPLLVILAAIISVNLWVFNLLPIPALDGWRLLLLWVRTFLEYIFGKIKWINNFENGIHIFFFLLLIALSLLIAYNDIINIFAH